MNAPHGTATRATNAVRAIRCDDLSTGLALLGLVLDHWAVVAVARKFVDLGGLRARLKNLIRKSEPPTRPAEMRLGAASGISVSGNLDIKGSAVESREATSLEAIHKDLPALEKRVGEMNVALEAKLSA